MTEATSDTDLYDTLDRLLDRERAALMSGDLPVLAGLLAEKEELLARIADGDQPESERLETLQGKAMRNQVLLDSALRGIRNVANRFATLRRIRRTLETYDEFGRKTVLPATPDPKVERRA